VSFTIRPLYLWCQLDRRLGGPQSRSGRRGEEKILDTSGTQTPTPRSPSPQPVTIPTTLSRFPRTGITFLHLNVVDSVWVDLSDTIGRVRSASHGTFPCISRSVKPLEGQGELPAADMRLKATDRFTPASFQRTAF
jgi:hypothetical protein